MQSYKRGKSTQTNTDVVYLDETHRCDTCFEIRSIQECMMASKDVMLLGAMPLSLDSNNDQHSYQHSEGERDTCSNQPRMDRHHTTTGHALDQSTLHTQPPLVTHELENIISIFSMQKKKNMEPEEDTSQRQYETDLAYHW